jgi:hypothetical protein
MIVGDERIRTPVARETIELEAGYAIQRLATTGTSSRYRRFAGSARTAPLLPQ